MPPVKWSAPAVADLNEIWSYISENDAASADRRIDRLRIRAKQLAALPFSGSVIEGRLRKLSSKPHLIYYEVDEGRVTVIRVIHSARDFDPLSLYRPG